MIASVMSAYSGPVGAHSHSGMVPLLTPCE
jgi:hypothetical protein